MKTWSLPAPCQALAILIGLGAAGLAAELPNVLWIVAEDINPHLGCYGDTNALTPNLDRFAGRSLRYRNCWSTAPVCAPARTALITGVYPQSSGAEHMRSLVPMPGFMRMYPQLLRDLGYYCVNNNKEDYNLVKPGQVWDESSGRAHYRNRPPGRPFFAAFNIALTHESRIRSRPHVLRQQPAAVRLPAYHPDTPEVRHDWAQYYDNITEMDAVAGRHLRELEEAGLADSTIVFFYGDNGSGMPRSKRWPYQSGLGVPLLVHVPDRFRNLAPRDYRAGGVSDRLVSFVDFAPTLLSLAGRKAPEWMQGRPFLGAFESPPQAWLFGCRGRMDERYDLVRSARNQRYVYARNFMPHLIYGQHVAYMFETPTTRVWQKLYREARLEPPRTFFWEPKLTEELYDLQTDPDEVRNLAGSPDHQAVLQELRQALRQHMLAVRDTGFVPEAERHRRVGNGAPYDFGHDPVRHPFESILSMAEQASSREPAAAPALGEGLKSKDSAVRYWATLGHLVRGSNAVVGARNLLEPLLKDESPSVRIAAALSLGQHGSTADLPPALAVLEELADPAKNGIYVSLEALNAIDALGAKAAPLRATLRSMARQDPKASDRIADCAPKLLRHILREGQ